MMLMGAMVIAIGTALGARAVLSGSSAPVAQAVAAVTPKGPRVLVAQRELPMGTIITADAVGFQEWPRDLVRDAYFAEGSVDMNKLIGTVVRLPVTAGQPLTQGSLVAPGDRGFLAAALGPGMRAITITVSEKTGVAGFVFPGDHVDLMLTQTVRGVGLDAAQPLNVTETILRNVRVLATDQSPETETANGKTVVHTFHTVTLEVNPRLAEKIEVAQTVGAISLVLRSIADTQCDLDHDIAAGHINLPTAANKQDQDKQLATACAGVGAHGLADSNGVESSFSTGGDVSRFQRHTIPSMKMPSPLDLLKTPGPHVKVIRGSTVSNESAGGLPGLPGLPMGGF